MISFDLDGVLANFIKGFTQIAHKLHGTPVSDTPAHQSWMFEDFPELNLTTQQCKRVWDEGILNNPDFWADLDPINVSVMKRINAIPNKMFITNRAGINPHGQSVRFLRTWGIDNPLVVVAKAKGPVAIDYGVTAHIDDYYPNCVDIQTARTIDGGQPACFTSLLWTPYTMKHHHEWQGPISLSVDHFLNEVESRGLIK